MYNYFCEIKKNKYIFRNVRCIYLYLVFVLNKFDSYTTTPEVKVGMRMLPRASAFIAIKKRQKIIATRSAIIPERSGKISEYLAQESSGDVGARRDRR